MRLAWDMVRHRFAGTFAAITLSAGAGPIWASSLPEAMA